MVKGETYYAKFQTEPAVTLTGYSGRWELEDKNHNIVKSGTLTKNTTDFEVMFDTSDMQLGQYTFDAFATFPDGFVQNISHDSFILE